MGKLYYIMLKYYSEFYLNLLFNLLKYYEFLDPFELKEVIYAQFLKIVLDCRKL